MDQKTLSKWLKCIIIGTGLCGLAVYAVVIPALGQAIGDHFASQNPEFTYYQPWLCIIWASGIPCYAVLFFAWKIATNIGLDHSFSNENARMLKWISILAAGDTAFFFMVNIITLLLNMNSPAIVLFSFIIVFVGIAVAVAAAALSHLVKKAAVLQEQSDLTI